MGAEPATQRLEKLDARFLSAASTNALCQKQHALLGGVEMSGLHGGRAIVEELD